MHGVVNWRIALQDDVKQNYRMARPEDCLGNGARGTGLEGETYMLVLGRVLVGALWAGALLAGVLPAGAEVFGCTRDKDHYSCNKSAFKKVLNDAKTVVVASHPENNVSEAALQQLVRDLGKTVRRSPAELTFVLAPTESDGVYFGPGNRELATLRVYAATADGGPGQLIWVESFAGQPDMPWPTVVHGAIQQFKEGLK